LQLDISQLQKLQEYDLEIQEIAGKTDELREQLDELVAMYESLTSTLQAQRAQLEETRALMRDKEIEIESNGDRYNQSKAKLNAVSNTREYNALEREMDQLRKMKAQLEEERDSLREAVEESEADVNDKAAKTAELESQIKEEEAAIDAEQSKTKRRISKLEGERDKLKEGLPKPLVRRYAFISSRRPGPAVVPAIDGTCKGCQMILPPQLYNELYTATKLIQCPTCQRILFLGEQAAAEDAGE
jgi:predicted  nucleic acid-binding Zn-ribbon protein